MNRIKHSDTEDSEQVEEVTPTGQDEDGDVIVAEDSEFPSPF